MIHFRTPIDDPIQRILNEFFYEYTYVTPIPPYILQQVGITSCHALSLMRWSSNPDKTEKVRHPPWFEHPTYRAAFSICNVH